MNIMKKALLIILLISFLVSMVVLLINDSTKKVKKKEINNGNEDISVKNNEINYDEDLKLRLKKIGATIEINETGLKELVFNSLPIRPIKNLSVKDREYFRNVVVKVAGTNPKIITKKFPGIKNEDFENTGKLESSIDFQILLNNILIRKGLEPQNGEHLDQIISELKKGNNE
jgi:hypothetical protein